jgi:peptide/nickel transport system substrate-binding protein
MTDNRLPAIGGAPSRRAFLTFAGVAGGLVLVGCSSSGSTGTTTGASGAAATGNVVKGGTLNFAWLGAPESLDPQLNTSFAGTNYANNIVDKLTWQDPKTGAISPRLAKSWTINADYTEFTFNLRDDVTFHDGTKFTATSVKNNFDQYVNGDDALGIKPNGAAALLYYKETQVISDYVVKVVFSQPSASFLQYAAYSGNNQPGFLGDKTLKSSAQERLSPANIIGTGPFKVTGYVPNETVTLTRNDAYNWGPVALGHTGPPYLDGIVFQTVPEASVRVGALQSGQVDAAFDIIPTDQEVLSATGYTLTSSTIAGLNLGWAFNLSLAPTNDINVRKAIVAATNRHAIVPLLAKTELQANSSLAPQVQGYLSYDATALAYDLDNAEKLLDDAGWTLNASGVREKDGVQLSLKSTSNILVPDAAVAYQAIQATLKEIGVEVSILLDTTNVSTEEINAQYHLINNNRSRDDAAILNVVFNPNRSNGNVLPQNDPNWDKWASTFEQLETTLDPAERAAYAKAAQDLIHEQEVLYLPVFVPSQVAASKTVQDIYLDATSRLLFLDTWIDK